MFDSLNRRALECYGGTVQTPNMMRFAEKAVTFDTHYAGSLPCMPARRDIHTGRVNFLHRSWGPLEPFDQSFPQLLKNQGTYTHLLTDHYHYLEDGGATYHNRYNTWDMVRGQEYDNFNAIVEPDAAAYKSQVHESQCEDPKTRGPLTQNLNNRQLVSSEKDYTMVRCFDKAFAFLDTNRNADNWLLQIECFDPHEPFSVPEEYKKAFKTSYNGPILDWPRYRKVVENEREIAEIQANYAALLTMCDAYFGRLLAYFDEHGLWENTALILTTDHGYMLAEHNWWAKNRMPMYNEVAHIPLMIYHPDYAEYGGARRSALTQTTDLMPTILELHNCKIPDTVEGHSLLPLLAGEQKIRDFALYGLFGAATNITDGRYTYFRYPEDMQAQELAEYTLLPLHVTGAFEGFEFEGAELVEGFGFMRGFPVLKIPAHKDAKRPMTSGAPFMETETALYDLKTDPHQMTALNAPDIEQRMIDGLKTLMIANEAPDAAFRRLGL